MATKDYGSLTDDYMTPLDSIVNKILGLIGKDWFYLDPACSNFNIPAERYYCKEPDYGFIDYYIDARQQDCEGGLIEPWHGEVFLNPPWKYTREWIKKAFEEVAKNNCEVWAVLPADRLNMVFFNKLLRENSNWFMVIPQVGEGQKFNFYNPHISLEDNDKNAKNGGFKKPFMILYIGKNSAEYASRWQKEQPITSIVMEAA